MDEASQRLGTPAAVYNAHGQYVQATPVWMMVVRAVQVFFSIVILIMAAVVLTGDPLPSPGFSVACALMGGVAGVSAIEWLATLTTLIFHCHTFRLWRSEHKKTMPIGDNAAYGMGPTSQPVQQPLVYAPYADPQQQYAPVRAVFSVQSQPERHVYSAYLDPNQYHQQPEYGAVVTQEPQGYPYDPPRE
ncbi:hypothetical protein VTJ83DRAFT_7099 [Remersonia thermophila]|uniref:Uncharacterized protein n=1 Tax=Remersonia thermophila TaxID=72144 RepID=A0ABR4D3K8_9PEZI